MRHALLFPLLLASCAGPSTNAVTVDSPAWATPAVVADDAVSVEVLFPAGSVSSAGPLEARDGGVRHPEASGWRTPPSLASSGPAELTEPAGKRTSTETASSATTAGVAQAGESTVTALVEGPAQEASSRGKRRA